MRYHAGTVGQAEGRARDLRSRVPGCGASWMINAPDQEWVSVLARPTTEFEPRWTRQLGHVIVVIPGLLVADILTAVCGTELPRSAVDFLADTEGMPCEACVAIISTISATSPAARLPRRCPGATQLPAPVHFERSPAVLARVLDGLSALGSSGVDQC